MSNKMKIRKVVRQLGCEIGCWNGVMELLNEKELDKVLANIKFDKDTDVKIDKKDYVVEIDTVDKEVDFSILTKEEYIDRYGDERYDN